ncbi:alpha-galactosidase [Parabacteroides sp. FAFU027]|uniref:alpha-galactosidase n=1 Tax=Parabacteroides sp. FAFU027 TaxID=2922715 RepID=UPI001FAF664D|nr:alpha-galactosidase [Parabacteroides sp. FAFU027]
MKRILLILIVLPIVQFVYSQASCYSSLKNDTLTIGNNQIERKFIWNIGNLITYSLTDKINKQQWQNQSRTPDFSISKDAKVTAESTCQSEWVKESEIHPRYLQTTVAFSLGTLQVKRVYRIYENSPAIACDTYLKGSLDNLLSGKEANQADMKNIEFAEDMKSKQMSAVLDQIHLKGQHWSLKAVEFFDVTDWNNNLVSERKILSYRKSSYRGNLLFASNGENDNGFFILKEAPCSGVQMAYQGSDFSAEFGKITVNGLGIAGGDIKPDTWVKTYGCVIGVYGKSELNGLVALRSYQKNIRKLTSDRDEMIMMNTWGDRSQDSKVNEKFCLQELECAARLGMTHFQIDDGWQTGKSPNSALARGTFTGIWSNKDYWKPDTLKYPRGLAPVVEKGRKLGIEICLWFNPSVQNDFADWEKDAQALIGLYKTYGIRIFKIDGLTIPSKQAEINLRNLFDKVLAETNNKVSFNLDATASRRGGYHMLNEYGNVFLENRYTDWQNYYPYWTLRNLWQLSKYVPAEKLQIEFLNKWRNAKKYGDDRFAPARYSFEYLFATAMTGQPLAWFEGSNLPEEAFKVQKLISDYKKVQHDFHTGVILPVGEEPSGRSWTGFQSIKDNKGYLLFFRENTPEDKAQVATWLPRGATVKCTPVLGNGKPVTATVGERGEIRVSIPAANDFVMYRYEVK